MRKVKIVANEYYHVYNRGNDKRDIFLDEYDYARFLFLILFFQAPVSFLNIGRYVQHYVKHSVFNIEEDMVQKIIATRGCELVSFTLMQNHFHLLLHEVSGSGISGYMQRALNGYTKYFNARYNKSGHLFQGPFQAVHIETNEQLLYTSAYIHRNQREIAAYTNNEHGYPWSSYCDYVKDNRWGDLLAQQMLTEQFPKKDDYREFVDKSGAKDASYV